MNTDTAIKVTNLSKVYTLRHQRTDENGVETNEHWALKDVSFEIKKGESVGIIGPNGSGKSTLLKLLAGVTKPTSGKIEIRGKVASILDIGAGFHPELSGRENVFLNGQIHGFSKKEIQSKLDEIVAFSGIEKFIDEPVKNYSNGMYLRLAFSIMAHLDFDVYLFDEVFSVGDEEFQNKCIKKLSSISTSNKTIISVYHNLMFADQIVNREIDMRQFQTKVNINNVANDAIVDSNVEFNRFDNNKIKFSTQKLHQSTQILLIKIAVISSTGVTIAVSNPISINHSTLNSIFEISLGVILAKGVYMIKIFELNQSDIKPFYTIHANVLDNPKQIDNNFGDNLLKSVILFNGSLV